MVSDRVFDKAIRSINAHHRPLSEREIDVEGNGFIQFSMTPQ